jgi:hypothetical protein
MDKIKKKLTRAGGSISWEEREAMVKEYLTGNHTKVEVWNKYTGQDEEHGQLLRWMRTLGYISNKKPINRSKKFLFSQEQKAYSLDTDNHKKDPVELQRRIKELERQLEIAKLKAEGYELMIEIAEKELKIPIRKKSGTK